MEGTKNCHHTIPGAEKPPEHPLDPPPQTVLRKFSNAKVWSFNWETLVLKKAGAFGHFTPPRWCYRPGQSPFLHLQERRSALAVLGVRSPRAIRGLAAAHAVLRSTQQLSVASECLTFRTVSITSYLWKPHCSGLLRKEADSTRLNPCFHRAQILMAVYLPPLVKGLQ